MSVGACMRTSLATNTTRNKDEDMAMFYDDVSYDVLSESGGRIDWLEEDLEKAEERNKKLLEKLEFILENSEEARGLANVWDASIKIQKGG